LSLGPVPSGAANTVLISPAPLLLVYFQQPLLLISVVAKEFAMLRKISAVLLGLLAAVATVMLIEWISHQIYPPPPDLDFKNPEQVRQHVATLPLGAFIAILFGWLMGTLAGGVVACQIAREKPAVFASIIGTVMMAATIANLIMIPHPGWFSIAGIVVIAAGTLLAIRWSATTGRVSRAF